MDWMQLAHRRMKWPAQVTGKSRGTGAASQITTPPPPSEPRGATPLGGVGGTLGLPPAATVSARWPVGALPRPPHPQRWRGGRGLGRERGRGTASEEAVGLEWVEGIQKMRDPRAVSPDGSRPKATGDRPPPGWRTRRYVWDPRPTSRNPTGTMYSCDAEENV